MRFLNRIKIEPSKRLKEILLTEASLAYDPLKEMNIIEYAKTLDSTNPLVILRHDDFYERYQKASSDMCINTGEFVGREEFIGKCIDCLIEGDEKLLPTKSWQLITPKPANVVIDLGGKKFDSYFEKRSNRYAVKEIKIEPNYSLLTSTTLA